MATADSSSKGTTHWKKITVQEMQGAMDAGSLKASLKQRFSNETLHKLPATNGANSSQQPGFESQANANDSAGNSHQAEHKEKSAVGDINVLAPGNDGVAKSTEPKAHSTTVPDTTVVKVSTEVHRGSGSTAAATSDLGKKQRRAERFGLSVQLSEDEKRKARAARFSINCNGEHGYYLGPGSLCSNTSKQIMIEREADCIPVVFISME
eukprot:Gb_18783 [translate_table: standard]